MKIEITILGLEPLAEAINNVAQAIKSRETLEEIKAGVNKILENPEQREETRKAAQKVQAELFPERKKRGASGLVRVDSIAREINKRNGVDKAKLRADIRRRYPLTRMDDGKIAIKARDAYEYRSLYYKPQKRGYINTQD